MNKVPKLETANATVLWFDSSSGQGRVSTSKGNYNIHLPIYGVGTNDYDFSKIVEGAKIVVIRDEALDDYGMIHVKSNK